MHQNRGFLQSGVCETGGVDGLESDFDGLFVDDLGLLEELLEGEFGGGFGFRLGD